MRISDWSSDVCSSDLVKFDDRAADGVEQQRADAVAGGAADNRGDGADRGDKPGALARRQDHRDEQHVGWNRKDRGFGEGDDGQRQQIGRTAIGKEWVRTWRSRWSPYR